MSSREVAERAGVSRSAVSRAFTPGASIAPATLERVKAAADALGYQVNHLARGLLAHRSHLVGLVTSDPETPFRAQMISALSRALIQRGNVPAIISVGPTAEDLANASRQLLGYRAEATVFLSGSPPASLIEMARRNGQPLVLINRAETGLDVVRCDDRGGARLAFDALRGSGTLHLGVISIATPSPSLLRREKTFARLAARRDISVTVARGKHSDYVGGREAARQLVSSGVPPEAVFCVNDLLAMGAVDEFRKAGLSIPDDISVIGFDDVPDGRMDALQVDDLATGSRTHCDRGRHHPRPPSGDPGHASRIGHLPRRARHTLDCQRTELKSYKPEGSVDNAVQLPCPRGRARPRLRPSRIQPSFPGEYAAGVPCRQVGRCDYGGNRRRADKRRRADHPA